MTDRDPLSYGIPHRSPFLFIHRVEAIRDGQSCICSSAFDPSADFFRGHFPGNPIVPGVILLEAMAQTAGTAAGKPKQGTSYLLSAVRNVKFFRAVRPGERVHFYAEKSGEMGGLLMFSVRAEVEGTPVAEGVLVLNTV